LDLSHGKFGKATFKTPLKVLYLFNRPPPGKNVRRGRKERGEGSGEGRGERGERTVIRLSKHNLQIS
jgi:hypothetical protein